ncbi:MAG: alanine racemase [Actinobacteria bacterium]|nr:alanine racemase [Actinomycetota bacterium]
MTRFRPTRVEVDLEAIRHNVRALKPEASELMAVVKANGYGHGDVAVARAALEAGATWLGVALVEEGAGLREAGIDAPILVLSELPPGSEREALARDLTPSLYSEVGLARLVEAAGERRVGVHVKVDTGMHRVGVFPPEEAPAFAERVAGAGLVVEGLWTHFARSEEDEATTKEQLSRFLDVGDEVRRRGISPRYLDAANSGATILHPEAHLDRVRAGIAIYGLEPGPGVGASLDLRPALAWRSAVTMVRRLPAGEAVSYGHRYRLERPSTLATVPVGYADGYVRLLSSRADVLIRGRRCRVAGSVTMDQLLADCGDLEVEPGDEVTLIGRQGDEVVSAEELARLSGTICYEVVTRIGERVPREHTG